MSTQVFRPGLHPSPSDTYDLVNHSTCFYISLTLIPSSKYLYFLLKNGMLSKNHKKAENHS